MTTFEHAGEQMLRLHEANRGLAQALANLFRRGDAQPTTPIPALSGPGFYEQEPDLAKETHLPGTYA